MDGWIKLYRKLLENPIMKKSGLLQLWVYCLLKANHEPGRTHFGKDDIDIMPGQFVTGRFELAAALGEKPSTIYKRISNLQTTGFLNINSSNKNSLITVVNWDLYQSAENESSKKNNNKVTTKEQQSSTNKNVRMKECKEVYIFMPPTIEQVKEYCKERNKGVNPEKWHDFYSSKGWMVGKNKMKDWKAAVRTWEQSVEQNANIPQHQNYKQREYTPDEINQVYDNQRKRKKEV